MEQNTVILPIEDYNKFKDIERRVENENAFGIYDEGKVYLFKESEKKLAERIDQLLLRMNELRAERDKLMRDSRIQYERQYKELLDIASFGGKKMSIWQFIKWRRS